MGRTGLVAMILGATALVGSCSTASPHAAAPPSTNSASPAADSTPPAPPTRRKAAEIYSTTRDAVIAIQVQEGSRRALDALSLLAQRELGVSGVCHAISHDLGHAALDQAGGRVGDALNDRDDACGGGFTHGVIEQALAESADPQAAMLTVCAPMQDGSCWHGVGHGLMFASGMAQGRALAGCDNAPSTLLSNRCGEGVFMQLFSADLAAHHADSTTLPIARNPQAARKVWLTVHPDDFDGALSWCRGAGSTFGKTMCARGLGSRTVKFHPEDLSIGARTCGKARDLVDACVRGMGSYWSVHWKGAVPASDICTHLPPGRARERCPVVTT
ncbi:MAG: hypothetical protein HQ453_14485 [Actinobacteria bacterium]|nr:hypothetical protein [Actinomycetota bacterium]